MVIVKWACINMKPSGVPQKVMLPASDPDFPRIKLHRCRNEILIGGGALVWKGMCVLKNF